MAEELTKCLLCGSHSLEKDTYATWKLNLVHPHYVTQCKMCRLRFLSPRPTASEYKQFYTDGSGPLGDVYGFSDDYYDQASAVRTAQYHEKLDLLNKVGAKGLLLELGSCTGAFLNEARNRGFEVEGIEPSEQDCHIAKERYDLNLHMGYIEDQNFPEEHFDVVFSSHVFEHLLNPLAVAKKISSWLRPGGFHMIEVPNQFEAISCKLRRLMLIDRPRPRTFRSIHHPVFFSPKTLRLLVELSGCQQHCMRNIYYRSTNIFQNPKGAVHKLLVKFFGSGHYIEILAQKE